MNFIVCYYLIYCLHNDLLSDLMLWSEYGIYYLTTVSLVSSNYEINSSFGSIKLRYDEM